MQEIVGGRAKAGLRDRLLEGFEQLKAGDLDAARATFSQLVGPIRASWQHILGSVGSISGRTISPQR